MIFGGIDTTGNTIGFLMYHLAANPDKQEILRKECLSIGPNLNIKNLNELKYLKACIQETFRLTPTISMLVRMLQENVTLQGKIQGYRNRYNLIDRPRGTYPQFWLITVWKKRPKAIDF